MYKIGNEDLENVFGGSTNGDLSEPRSYQKLLAKSCKCKSCKKGFVFWNRKRNGILSLIDPFSYDYFQLAHNRDFCESCMYDQYKSHMDVLGIKNIDKHK